VPKRDTGILRAFKTKPGVLPPFITEFNGAAKAVLWFLVRVNIAACAGFIFAQVSLAAAAIDSAWGNHLLEQRLENRRWSVHEIAYFCF